MNNKAIILGASGLIGSQLLDILIESPFYTEIVVLVRKPLDFRHPKVTQHVTDFKNLDELAPLITGRVIFSCLGSTKAKTPNKEDYTYVDKVIPEKIALLGNKNNVEQFHLVSALGANSNSSIFYNRLKGETEDSIKKSGIPGIFIYQPSLIKGPRKEKRFGESFAISLSAIVDPLLIGSLKRYRSIESIDIAKAMYNQSITNKQGTYTFPSDKIKELA
ncbi:nucleoside-diphosphate sugar epimerase [Pseudoxanthomonas sp. SGD-10]|nr:nucleoside-diphosphate sugar epimerase [Pseudoxanthomonas sp. SGD-10]